MTHWSGWRAAGCLVSFLLVGCAGGSCPKPAQMPCLTKRVCTVDSKGCESCACEAAPQSRPEQDQPGKRLSP